MWLVEFRSLEYICDFPRIGYPAEYQRQWMHSRHTVQTASEDESNAFALVSRTIGTLKFQVFCIVCRIFSIYLLSATAACNIHWISRTNTRFWFSNTANIDVQVVPKMYMCTCIGEVARPFAKNSIVWRIYVYRRIKQTCRIVVLAFRVQRSLMFCVTKVYTWNAVRAQR